MPTFSQTFGTSTGLHWTALSLALLAVGWVGMFGALAALRVRLPVRDAVHRELVRARRVRGWRPGGGRRWCPGWRRDGAYQSVDRTLRSQGFQPLGQLIQQRMPPRGLVAFPVNAHPACATRSLRSATRV